MDDCDCEESAVTWTQLADIDPGVIGGLVLQHARQARAQSYDMDGDRDNATFWAVAEALESARRGAQPDQPVDRLPTWIASLLRGRIARHSTYWLDTSFLVVRVLELAGLLQLAADDEYVLAMVTGLTAETSRRLRTAGDPVEWFRHDPGLIERAYWRALALEGVGVLSIRVGSWREQSPWRTATLTMITEGMVSRDRVIDTCLSALAQDFASAAARWYVGTLTTLELTVEELDDRQPRLRRLLAQRSQVITPAVLGWLCRLEEAARLDGVSTAPALAAVTGGGPRATALAGLRLLTSIQRGGLTADVVPAARAGLRHPHSDVQRSAAKLLTLVGRRDIALADADVLDPGVRRELDIPLGPESSVQREPTSDEPAGTTIRRPPQSAISDNDLVERLAALLEDPSDPHDIELILDRLARSPVGDLLAPLTKRARTVVKASPGNWEGNDRLRNHLADLVLATVEPRVRATTLGPPVPAANGSRFLHHRITEVRQIVLGESAPRPLLALPTDPAGWLDAEVFVSRVLQTPLLGRFDLIAALLRLTEAGRSAALTRWRTAAAPFAPDVEQPVRYALGEEPAAGAELRDRALWVAASRGRRPLEDDPLLIANGLTGSGQGRPLRATITFGYEADHLTPLPGVTIDLEAQAVYRIAFDHPYRPESKSRSRRESWWTASQRRAVDQPTAMADLHRDYERPRESWPIWLATLWPSDAEFYAATAFDTAFDLMLWQPRAPQMARTMSMLKDHPGRMSLLAHTTFALGLGAASVNARVVAVDLIVNLVERRRVSIADLASALAASLPIAVLSRWADSLGRLAHAGHPHIAIDLITSVLPHIPPSTRGVHALLDLLHQELLRTGQIPTDRSLRSYLSSFSGSSNSARSARAILTLI